MPNVLIEKYREIKIYFSPEDETFFCSIDENRKLSKSFIAVKKNIDEYIKANESFKPFQIITTEYRYSTTDEGKILTIVGLRKDGRFVIENAKGEKEQLSEWNEERYIVYNKEKHDQQYATLAYLQTLADEANKAVQDHRKTIKGISLESIKEKYKR